MRHELLVLTEKETGRKFAFNPMTVAAIYEMKGVSGTKITVQVIMGHEDSEHWIDHDFDEAVKLWQEAINT